MISKFYITNIELLILINNKLWEVINKNLNNKNHNRFWEWISNIFNRSSHNR